MVERSSAGNLKQTWTIGGRAYDFSDRRFEGPYLLTKATQVKNIWTPCGAERTLAGSPCRRTLVFTIDIPSPCSPREVNHLAISKQ